MKTLVIIPAFNEELTIGSVVTLAKKYGDVLVIDDGSEDRTAEIAERVGAKVLRHSRNIGKGAALVKGFSYALSNDYDVVICMDGDGQHDADDIPQLLEPIRKGVADVVIGSRYLSKSSNIPFYRKVGLFLINLAEKLAAGNIRVKDTQSGLRAFRVSILKNLKITSSGYEVESEMLAKILKRGYKVKEIPASFRYDVPKGHKKSPLSHGLAIMSHLINIFSYRRPLFFFGTLGLASFLIAAVLALWALEPYYITRRIYLTQMIGAGIFTILGVQMLTTGLVMNLVIKMIRELNK